MRIQLSKAVSARTGTVDKKNPKRPMVNLMEETNPPLTISNNGYIKFQSPLIKCPPSGENHLMNTMNLNRSPIYRSYNRIWCLSV